MKKMFRTLAFASAIAFGLMACEKKDTDDTNGKSNTTDTQSVSDNSTSENEFDDLGEVVRIALEDGSENQRVQSSLCAIITFPTDSIIIDFGDSAGCKSNYDQRTRKGKLKVHYTGPYWEDGSVITITPENYSVTTYLGQEYKIEGKKVLTNQGDSTFKLEVMNGLITFPDGKTSTWNSTRYRKLTDAGTAAPLDETWSVWGDANGVNQNGLAYTMNVPENDPLVVDIACWLTKRMPVSGTLTISPEGVADRVVDYGNGECDDEFTVSIGNFTINFPLQ